MRRLEYIIEERDAGRRAGDFLRREQHFSYALIVKLRHASDSLKLDGEFIRTIDRLKAGSVLSVELPETAGEALPNAGIFVPVIYEDEDIIVFDKPAGVPVHPSKGHQTDTLRTSMRQSTRIPDFGLWGGSIWTPPALFWRQRTPMRRRF